MSSRLFCGGLLLFLVPLLLAQPSGTAGADRVRAGETGIAEAYPEATVLVAEVEVRVGVQEVPGKGQMRTYLLQERREAE